MHDFDFAKLRGHRRAEAAAGFPLLRGCANTLAIARLTYLDALTDVERIAFADQLSDLDDRQTSDLNGPLGASVPATPLVEGYLATRFAPAQGVAFMPVKLYAGVCKDDAVGGFAGWANMVAMPVAAQIPAVVHAASLAELVPVAPRRLRGLIDDGIAARWTVSSERISSDHTRYRGTFAGGSHTVDILFARGMGAGHQFLYQFNANTSDGRRVAMKSYEDVWRLPARWDYMTEVNADRSITHVVRLLAACIELI